MFCYVLEVFLSWEAFSARATEGSEILVEDRARDDDMSGEEKYPLSFLQWSTDQKTVESDGIGLGTLTLLEEEATLVFLGFSIEPETISLSLSLNPAVNEFTVRRGKAEKDILKIANYTGQVVLEIELLDKEETIQVTSLPSGIYVVHSKAGKKMLIIKK